MSRIADRTRSLGVNLESAQARLDAAFGMSPRLRADLAKGVIPREIIQRHQQTFSAPLSPSHGVLVAGIAVVLASAIALKPFGKGAFFVGLLGVSIAVFGRVRLSLAERVAADTYRASLGGKSALRLCEGETTSFRTWDWGPGDVYELRLHLRVGDEEIRVARPALAGLQFRGPMRLWFYRGPAFGSLYPSVETLIAIELGDDATVGEASDPVAPPLTPGKFHVPADSIELLG